MMHPIQKKLLDLISVNRINLDKYSLRQLARLIGEIHPQKIAYHLEQLENHGFIQINKRTQDVKRLKQEGKVKGRFVILPVLGAADCGSPNLFAEECLEGYIKISSKIINSVGDFFVIRAKGNSMNKADIKGKSIENGDLVVVNKNKIAPTTGDYVVVVIDDLAVIKRIHFNKQSDIITLVSESTEKHPPILLCANDKFNIAGTVEKVLKGIPKVSTYWLN